MHQFKFRRSAAVALALVTLLGLVLAACAAVNAGGNQPAPAVSTSAASLAQPTSLAQLAAPEAATRTAAAPAGASAPAAATATNPAAVPSTVAAMAATAPVGTATNAGAAPTAAVTTTTAPAATATATSAPATAVDTSTTQAAAQPAITCTPGALTPAETEGPYYKANPPERSDLLNPDMAGTKLTITGYVLDADCRPVAGARVDFWQADDSGAYDNAGYTLRGYQMTDATGRYTVQTVVPGLYTGRTRHIHVKVTPPGGATLTTQLYFPGEQANSRDGIFDPKMVMSIQNTADSQLGTFNFEVKAG